MIERASSSLDPAHVTYCTITILLTGFIYYLLYCLSFHLRFTEPTKQELTVKDRPEWHSKLWSSVSAALVVLMCVPVIPEALQWSELEKYYGYAPNLDIASRLFTGFLVFDTTHMIVHRKLLADTMFWQFMIHHFLFMTTGTLFSYYGNFFRFQFLWLIAGECSNPFINFRWHLAVMGEKGLLYLLNGLVATIIFGSFRVVLYAYGLYHLYRTRYIWLDESAPHVLGINIFTPMVILIVGAYFLNLFWFHFMLSAVQRALSRNAHSGKDE